jgi:hypothetical protein
MEHCRQDLGYSANNNQPFFGRILADYRGFSVNAHPAARHCCRTGHENGSAPFATVTSRGRPADALGTEKILPAQSLIENSGEAGI